MKDEKMKKVSKWGRPRFYKVCSKCGATLDYGETCDCDKVIKKGGTTNANYKNADSSDSKIR